MARRPELIMPVDAHGTLRLDMPGGEALDLVAEGARLTIDLQGLTRLGAFIPGSWRARRRSLRFAANALSTCGLTFSLESAGEPILQFGSNTRPSWIARLMRLGPVNLPFSAIFRLFRIRAA